MMNYSRNLREKYMSRLAREFSEEEIRLQAVTQNTMVNFSKKIV